MPQGLEQVTLQRIGGKGPTVGMISLPLPRELKGQVGINHKAAALQPVAWWERHKVSRRSLAFVVDNAGVPDTLKLTDALKPAAPASTAWKLRTQITTERMDFKKHIFADIASLRGVKAVDCTTVEFELHLTYGGKTLVIQPGATGPNDGGPYYWQNVQVDYLWSNEVVQAVRVGGIIFNGDTYLWADMYLLLFANGVAQATTHFVNRKLHIAGYDFQGLPYINFAGEGLSAKDAKLPTAGMRQDLGLVKLNLDDAAILCSEQHPGTLRKLEGGVQQWQPFDRTVNPQLPHAPVNEWPVGFARTVRFTFSMSDAAPEIARYKAPAWWYTQSGEPWSSRELPVKGRRHDIGLVAADEYQKGDRIVGRFDGGNGNYYNDGFTGTGLMVNYYMSGKEDLLADALNYCYYWADIAVDHSDYTVHQWIGGWQWKTCAYSKFRDVLYGYLETGDPYMLETVENVADSYWMWFRGNWPRCTIGRDGFEIGGTALLWRYLRTERHRERSREFAHMLAAVLRDRPVIGGQMGAGPHPGYISSLYMAGVCQVSLLEVADAEAEEGHTDRLPAIFASIDQLQKHYSRRDVEMFPSSYKAKVEWPQSQNSFWSTQAMRITTQMPRLRGSIDELTATNLKRTIDDDLLDNDAWGRHGRPGDNFVMPWYHDALLLGATWQGDGVTLAPLGDPTNWPAMQTVLTPRGELTVSTAIADGKVKFTFKAAEAFNITVKIGKATAKSTSTGSCELDAPSTV
jgi:hypothetical protein